MEPSQHARKRPPLETLLASIPGFKGYFELESRRDSDRLQREAMATRLERAKRAVTKASQCLAEAGSLDTLPQLDQFRGRLDKLISRLRGAMRGYSGFFDLVQVDAELLDRVYDHDAEMMFQTDELAEAIEKLPATQAQVVAALPDLDRRLEEVERQLDQREDILRGIADGA